MDIDQLHKQLKASGVVHDPLGFGDWTVINWNAINNLADSQLLALANISDKFSAEDQSTFRRIVSRKRKLEREQAELEEQRAAAANPNDVNYEHTTYGADGAPRMYDNDMDWTRAPHGIRIGTSFNSLQEAIAYAVAPDMGVSKEDGESLSATMLDKARPVLDGFPYTAGERLNMDTSLGGTEALNQLWQFNRDDDIVHPMLSADGGIGNVGMGRVFKEMYYDNQHILWLRMGVPKLTGLAGFYGNAVNNDAASLMNSGSNSTIGSMSSFIGSALRIAIELPVYPITGTYRALNKVAGIAADGKQVTDFYYFKPAMPLYFKMVNSILAHFSLNLGLSINGTKSSTGGADENAAIRGLSKLPEVMRIGPDIHKILAKRFARKKGISMDNITTTEQLAAGESSFFDDFGFALDHASVGAFDHIGFRIEKGTEVSETISNTIGESGLASSLKSKGNEVRDKLFTFGQSGGSDGVMGTIKDIVSNFVAGFSSTAAGAIQITTGAANLDIPEVWKGSNYSKSYSFEMELRAKNGDPVSYYQSICVPLACMIAAAAPRATGRHSYTSPFVIEAYSKGMFSAPLAMIESLTIRRGDAEHGWTYQNLPTVVKVSMTIKDLSPAFFLSLADSSFLDVFSANTSMQNYLCTLAGLGMADSTFFSKRFDRKVRAAYLSMMNNTANPLSWGVGLGNSGAVRLVSNFRSGWKTPNRR